MNHYVYIPLQFDYGCLERHLRSNSKMKIFTGMCVYAYTTNKIGHATGESFNVVFERA